LQVYVCGLMVANIEGCSRKERDMDSESLRVCFPQDVYIVIPFLIPFFLLL
jgi:hypothetical protein